MCVLDFSTHSLGTHGHFKPITAVIAELVAFGLMRRENTFWLAWPGAKERGGRNRPIWQLLVDSELRFDRFSTLEHKKLLYHTSLTSQDISSRLDLNETAMWCTMNNVFYCIWRLWIFAIAKVISVCKHFPRSALFPTMYSLTVRSVALGSSLSAFWPHMRESDQTRCLGDKLPIPQTWALRCMQIEIYVWMQNTPCTHIDLENSWETF